jgi:hypothetical protein
MKLMRSISLVVAAFGLVGLSAATAAAQAPAVAWQQNGGTLSINWTAVPGATQYDLTVSGAVSGAVTIPTNFLIVNAPAGTYVIQVRGRNGGTVGPLSDPVTINVGGNSPAAPGGCAPLTTPAATAAVSSNVVTINWAAVPGAIGYRIQVGTTPGATQFQVDVPASQLSYGSAIPVLGTFYARVIAANACGTVLTSPETSFTVGAATPGPGTPTPGPGAGPRTADPPPGQLIPRATLGYLQGVVTQVASQYRGDLLNSCTEDGGNHNYMYRVVSALRRIDSRWGMNDKRGQRNDMSHDIVTYNPTNRPDAGESQVYLFDVISGHCGGNPGPNWQDVTDVTWAARGNPACGTEWCARWTIDNYLRAGFQP